MQHVAWAAIHATANDLRIRPSSLQKHRSRIPPHGVLTQSTRPPRLATRRRATSRTILTFERWRV
jgi:hypothetical protein